MATKEQKAKWAREYYKRKRDGISSPGRGENLKKHGETKSPEHRSWLSMMTRCVWSDKSRPDWHLYQGKGIKVCERWLVYSNFLKDMGRKPTTKHTLDRKDSDVDYEPGNCWWRTPKQQARNWKRRNVLHEFAGERLTLSEWAERVGISRSSMEDRITHGWSNERAFTTPPIRQRERSVSGTFKAVVG